MNFKKNFKRFFTLSRSAEGFTLVELIVVIAILGILVGVGMPAYSGYIDKANEGVDEHNLAMMNNALVVACVYVGVEPAEAGLTTDDMKWSNDGKTFNGLGTGIATASEGETETTTKDDVVKLFNTNLGQPIEFKKYTSADIKLENGVFVGPNGTGGNGGSGSSGSTGVFGPLFDGFKNDQGFQTSVNNLNNSTFGTIGAQGLMQKVDTVTGLAAGLAEENEGFLNSLVGTMGAMQTTLGMSDEEFGEYFMGIISEKAGTTDVESDAFQQARYEVLANYAVLNAAQNTGTDKGTIINNLKGGITVSDIQAMISKDGDAATQQAGMANAAMMYAMYTAYANALPSGTEEEQTAKEAALSITGDIGTFASTMANQDSSQYTGFQAYLNQYTGEGTSQVEKDLDGYLGAMNIINQSASDKDAVADLLVNGYDNAELINALQGLMG